MRLWIRLRPFSGFAAFAIAATTFFLVAIFFYFETIERSAAADVERLAKPVPYVGSVEIFGDIGALQRYAEMLHSSHDREIVFVDKSQYCSDRDI